MKSNAPLPTITPNPYPTISFLNEEHDNRFVVSSGIDIPIATRIPVLVYEKLYLFEIFSRVAYLVLFNL